MRLLDRYPNNADQPEKRRLSLHRLSVFLGAASLSVICFSAESVTKSEAADNWGLIGLIFAGIAAVPVGAELRDRRQTSDGNEGRGGSWTPPDEPMPPDPSNNGLDIVDEVELFLVSQEPVSVDQRA